MIPKIFQSAKKIPLFFIKKYQGFYWWQKLISLVLLVVLISPLFIDYKNLSFSHPSQQEYSLVTVLVDESVYASIPDKIERYALDVQSSLDRTKVLVLPVPSSASSVEIFHILQSWYTQGIKKGEDVFFLKGSVFIGDIPLPQIFTPEKTIPSIFPYTDFSDPYFLYQEEYRQWFVNPESQNLRAEIWHGLIPAGSKEEMNNFFDKNHQVHQQHAKGEDFYSDQLLFIDFENERESAHPLLASQYDLRQKYQEDLVYGRYTQKFLSKVLKHLVNGVSNIGIDSYGSTENDGYKGIDNDFDGKVDEDPFDQIDNDGDGKIDEDLAQNPFERIAFNQAVDISDTQVKAQIEKMLPSIREVMSGGIRNVDEIVEMGGRWKGESIDTIPEVIDIIDVLVSSGIKEMNTGLERSIIDQIENKWQQPLLIPLQGIYHQKDDDETEISFKVYNYVNGQKAENINSVKDCVYHMGSNPVADDDIAQKVSFSTLYDPLSAQGLQQCANLGGCCGFNSLQPERCDPNFATNFTFSWRSGKLSGDGETSYLACDVFNFRKGESPYNMDGRPIDPSYSEVNLKTIRSGTQMAFLEKAISSVVVHSEPHPESLKALSSSLLKKNLPVDSRRYIDFQTPAQEKREIEFPNLFDIPSTVTEKSDAEISVMIKSLLQQKEDEIRQKMDEDNRRSYEKYLLFLADNNIRSTPLSFDDFVAQNGVLQKVSYEKGCYDEIDNSIYARHTKYQYDNRIFVDNQCSFHQEMRFYTHRGLIPEGSIVSVLDSFTDQQLAFTIRWQHLSLDEKYQLVFKLLFDKNNVQTSVVPDVYAHTYLRLEGEQTPLWKGVKKTDLGTLLDPRIDEFLEENSVSETDQLVEESKCGPIEGVPLWEWVPAVMCWIEEEVEKAGKTASQMCKIHSNRYDELMEEITQPFINQEDTEILSAVKGEIFFSSDPLLPTTENIVGVSLLDKNNDIAKYDFIPITYEVIGAKTLTYDADPLTPGFQDYTEFGYSDIEIIPDEGIDFVTIRVSAELSDGEVFQDEKVFSVAKNPFVSLEIKDQWDEQSVRFYKAVVTAQHEEGVFDSFLPSLYVGTPSPARVFISDQEVDHKGEVIFGIRSDQPETVLASSFGFKSHVKSYLGVDGIANIPFNITAEEIPSQMDINSQYEIKLEYRNIFGQIIPFSNEITPVVKFLDTPSLKNAVLEGDKLFIETGNTADEVFIQVVLDQYDVEPLYINRPVGVEIDLENFSANTLSMTLLGLEDFSETPSDHIATKLLYNNNSSLQGVVSHLGNSKVKPALLQISNNGDFSLLSDDIISQVRGVSPLQLSFFHEQTQSLLAEFLLKFSDKENVLLRTRTPQAEEKGVFYVSSEDSGMMQTEIIDERIILSLEGRPVLTVSSDLSVEIFDAHFSVQLDENSTEGVSFWVMLNDNESIGKIILRGAEFFPTNINPQWVESYNGNFRIIDPFAEKKHIFPDLFSALTHNSFGAGFKDEEKFVHLFASQNTLGEAVVASANPFLTVFGDPTISLYPPEKNDMGHDTTMGTQIFVAGDALIEEIFEFNADGDGNKDVLIRKSDGFFELLTQDGYGNFQSKNDFFFFSSLDFSQAQVSDVSGNGYDDIIILATDGAVNLFSNNNGVLTPIDLPVSHPLNNSTFLQISIDDMDNDKKPDLVGIEKDGSVSIFYSEDNAGFITKQKIGDGRVNLKKENSFDTHIFIGVEDIEKVIPESSTLLTYNTPQKTRTQEIGKTEKKPPVALQSVTNNLEQKYVVPASFFSSDFVSKKRFQEDLNSEGLVNGDLVKTTVSFTANPSAQIETILADIPQPFLYPLEETIECIKGCNTGVYMGVTNTPRNTVFLDGLVLDPGKEVSFSYVSRVVNIPVPKIETGKINNDEYLDVALVFENNIDRLLTYQSSEKRSYTPEFITKNNNTPAQNALDNFYADENNNGVPDQFEKDENGNQIPDFAEEYLQDQSRDVDNDGIPNEYDSYPGVSLFSADVSGNNISITLFDGNSEQIQNIESALDEAISLLSGCSSGSCFAMPINNAFFVPGQFNAIGSLLGPLTGGVSGGGGAKGLNTGVAALDGVSGGIASLANNLDSAVASATSGITNIASGVTQKTNALLDKIGIPTFFEPFPTTVLAVGAGTVCVGRSCVEYVFGGPKPIPYPVGFSNSQTRLYLSPTLTGGLGVAVCKMVNTYPPLPEPVPRCFVQAVPSSVLQDMIGVCEDETGDIASSNRISFGDGQKLFRVESRQNSHISGAVFEFDLGSLDVSIPADNNIRVNSGGGYLSRWANEQIKEFAAMFTLPRLIIYAPKIPETLFTKDALKSFYHQEEWENSKKEFQSKFSPKKNNNKQITEPNNIETSNSLGASTEDSSNSSNNIDKNDSKSEYENFFNAAKNGVTSVYESLEPAESFLQNAQHKASSIEDLYEMVESIPLIRLQKEIVTIEVPMLTRDEIQTMLTDLESLEKQLEQEYSGLINSFGASCDEASVECSAEERIENMYKEKITIEYNQLIYSINKNKEVLKSYFDLPQYLAQIDTQVAEYIYTVVCYVEAIENIVGSWLKRNKIRYEKWKEFFVTAKEIMKTFQILPKVFRSYKSYCETCRAENYSSGGFLISLLGSVLPTPPIIKFPRLPDIVLDVSQINAGITVTLPVIQIQPRPITFPQIPSIYFPRVPDLNFSLPQLPILPSLPDLPDLPPLPPLELPYLPNLPPPPLIPKVLGSFGSLLSVIEKGLFLYCLIYKKAIFVYPETTIKSVIESLTARPASPLSIDFLSQSYPNFNIPSISEIRVDVEVNLEADTEFLVKPIQEFADEINKESSNLLNAADKYITQQGNENTRDAQEILDQSKALDDVSRVNDEWNQSVNDINNKTQKITDDWQKESDKVEDSLQEEVNKSLGKVDITDPSYQLFTAFLSADIQKLRDEFSSSHTNEYITASEMRKIMGLPRYRYESYRDKPLPQYESMVAKLKTMQEDYLDRSEKFLAMGQNTKDFDDYLASLDPKNTQYFTAEEKLILDFSSVENFNTKDLYNNSFIEPQNNISVTHTASQAAQITEKQGVYIQDDQTKATYLLMDLVTETENIHSFISFDMDGDNDNDVFWADDYGVYVKENRNNLPPKKTYSQPIEIFDFYSVSNHFSTVKNFEVFPSSDTVSFDFYPEKKEEIAGLLLIATNSVFDSTRKNATKRKKILLLKQEYFELFQQQYNFIPEEFFIPQQDIVLNGAKIHLETDEEFMILPLTGYSFEIPFNSNYFYSLSAKWLLPNGKSGIPSTLKLSRPEKRFDKQSPFVIGKIKKQGYIYRENMVSVYEIFDTDSFPTVAWDFDGDGVYEKNGVTVKTPVYTSIGERNISILIGDGNGNNNQYNLELDIQAPQITLDQPALENKKTVQGEIQPGYSSVPFVLLRDRLGVTKKIKTSTADQNGYYQTDENGEYVITDFNLSKNIVIKDHSGKIVGEVLQKTGKLVPRDENYSVLLIPSNEQHPLRQVLLDAENAITANVVMEIDSQSAVEQYYDDRFTPYHAGVFVKDLNPSDTFVFGPIESTAPSLANGMVFFDQSKNTPLLGISAQGNIQPFDNDFAYSLHLNDTEESLPLSWKVRSNGKDLFEVTVLKSKTDLSIDYSLQEGGRIISFSPSQPDQYASLDAKISATFPFADIPQDSPYRNSIQKLYDENLLSGYVDGSFKPEKKISRAEFVHLSMGVTYCLDCANPSEFEKALYPDTTPFPDIFPEDWYGFCVAKGKKLQMVMGYGNGLFMPDDPITRAEAVAVLLRQSDIPLEQLPKEAFNDVSKEAWYYPYLVTALNLGMIDINYGFVFPDEKITRGEMAQMMEVLFSIRNCKNIDSDSNGVADYIEQYNGVFGALDSNNKTLINPLDKVFTPVPFNNSNAVLKDNESNNINNFINESSNENTVITGGNQLNNINIPNNTGGENGSFPKIFIEHENDQCLFVPEDIDGIDDNDGCPEPDLIPVFNEKTQDNEVVVFWGEIESCGFIDYLSDIITGDLVYTSILSPDEKTKYSQSNEVLIP